MQVEVQLRASSTGDARGSGKLCCSGCAPGRPPGPAAVPVKDDIEVQMHHVAMLLVEQNVVQVPVAQPQQVANLRQGRAVLQTSTNFWEMILEVPGVIGCLSRG